jgi:ankyrin repeat protein
LTPLIIAAFTGNLEPVKLLAEAGAQLEAKDNVRIGPIRTP